MFLIEQPDDGGVPSVYPQFNTIQRNLMIANYNSQEGVDNDDGSGFFHTHNNVIVYGNMGQKADMADHDNYHRENLYAYIGLCYCDMGGGEVTNASHRDYHQNNTCIQLHDAAEYASVRCEFAADNRTLPDCTNTSEPACTNHTEDGTQPYFSGNTIYNPSGKTGQCGMPLAAWQALGNDPGTTVHGPIPSKEAILAMARTTLGLGAGEGDTVRRGAAKLDDEAGAALLETPSIVVHADGSYAVPVDATAWLQSVPPRLRSGSAWEVSRVSQGPSPPSNTV
jgi:hypothetical protein